MKTAFLAVIALAFTAVPGGAASPASLPMGIDISERDGVLEVREVARGKAGMQCRECVHLGGRCTIGDGSCYASEHASCTWCGNHCKSICVGDGQSCQQWCL